jgi:hypothetical protein
MTQTAISQSHKLKRMRWAARIISLLPGAGMILGYLSFDIGLFFRKGVFYWHGLAYELRMPAMLLAIGGISWRWPRVGGALQILVAIYLFSLLIMKADFAPELVLPIAFAFLVGAILHLRVSHWR